MSNLSMLKTLQRFEFGRARSISADAERLGYMLESVVSIVETESFSKMRTQVLEQGYVENYTEFYDSLIDRNSTFCFHSILPSMT